MESKATWSTITTIWVCEPLVHKVFGNINKLTTFLIPDTKIIPFGELFDNSILFWNQKHREFWVFIQLKSIV